MTHTDPFRLFAEFFELAVTSGIVEPNAMNVATVGPDGRPSSRIVLLKEYDTRGFVFYTNLESRKGLELRQTPYAALCFFWQSIGRQVRIEGDVTLVDDAEADAYFATRPRGSQIGAWASQQSRHLSMREELLDRVAEIERRYENMDVPRPPFWSGFRVAPHRFEFWTAELYRLHDRLLFERDGDAWRSETLYP